MLLEQNSRSEKKVAPEHESQNAWNKLNYFKLNLFDQKYSIRIVPEQSIFHALLFVVTLFLIDARLNDVKLTLGSSWKIF